MHRLFGTKKPEPVKEPAPSLDETCGKMDKRVTELDAKVRSHALVNESSSNALFSASCGCAGGAPVPASSCVYRWDYISGDAGELRGRFRSRRE